MLCLMTMDSLRLQPPSSTSAPAVAKQLLEWLSNSGNDAEAAAFMKGLVDIDAKACPIFFQYVTDIIFKELVKSAFPIVAVESGVENAPLTYEVNALRYAAGYVPRAVRKKLRKLRHPLRGQLLLCLHA